MLFQVLSAVAIFFTLSAFTFIPYCYLIKTNKGSNQPSRTLSICNCVACGIFLSTCFLGLIPHVRHQEMNMWAQNNTMSAPMKGSHALTTETIVLLGFLLILVIEQALLLCSTPSSKTHTRLPSSPRVATSFRGLMEADEDGHPLVDTTLDTDDEMHDIVFRSTSPSELRERVQHGHSHALPIEDGLSARTLFLLLGLSVHSAFEGVALGVQNDKTDFINVLVAIMFHEVLCCVAYGISMAQQRTPMRAAAATALILAASIPGGMIVALMAAEMESGSAQVFRFVMEGLAAGTFVYVACVEMLSSELGGHGGHSHSHDDNDGVPSQEGRCVGLGKASAVVAGVGIFWLLQSMLPRHH